MIEKGEKRSTYFNDGEKILLYAVIKEKNHGTCSVSKNEKLTC